MTARIRVAAPLAAISLLAALGGCGSDGEGAEGSGAGDGDAVEIVDFAYAPAELTVDAGTKISFSNRDSTAHTATADDGSFDTGTLEDGKSGAVRLDQPGTYAYHCLFHPFMKGSVRVE